MLSTMKKNRQDNATTIATWSLNGRLTEPTRHEELFTDMKWKNVDIAALQETIWSHDAIIKDRSGAMIINFKINAEGYRGLAFYLSPKWAERLTSTKIINTRMAAARLKAFNVDKADLVAINAHAPTMTRAKENPELTEAIITGGKYP